MKKPLFIVGGLTIFLIGGWYFLSQESDKKNFPLPTQSSQTQISPSSQDNEEAPVTTTIAENLDTPWGIVFLPDGALLVTERPGRVRFIDSNGVLDSTPIVRLDEVKEIGEGGLLGITIDPEFSENNYVYLYYTYNSVENDTLNRVVRMTYKDKKLSDEKVIVDKIPGASNHNGGRIKFGPDKLLYIATGDAQNSSRAQDTNSLAGKILRATKEGKRAPANPFNNLIFSYGHRNVQGLAWDKGGSLWATEHGRSGVVSGLDEINRIEAGRNYGWPTIQGDETRQGMETPVRNSGPATTWAPAGATFVGDSFFFGGLRGETLYEAVIEDNNVTSFKEHFAGEFGRIRDVLLGPDGMLYTTTSNRDGRGNPATTDDRIIRVNPEKI